MSRSRRTSLAFASFCLALLAACGGEEPTRPKLAPTMRIVAGAGVSDTVGARLLVPLTVEVRDSTGQPARRAPITFRVSPVSGMVNPPFDPVGALVSPTSYTYLFGAQTAMREWTDAEGRAAVWVHLGTLAGPIGIVITGDSLPVRDSASFTVLPGAPVAIDVRPRDTSLYVGASMRPRVRSLDRLGNARPDPVTIAVGDSVVAAGAGAVTGRRYGRDAYDVSTPTHSLRAWVSVVPEGTIAAQVAGYAGVHGVGVINLDGSGGRLVVASNDYGPAAARNPQWSPDGRRIAFMDGYYERSRAYTVDAGGGTPRRLTDEQWAAANQVYLEGWPTFSADGRWIYFSAGPTYFPGGFRIWRAPSDGSAAPERVTSTAQGGHVADASPDGSRLAYFHTASYSVHVLDLPSGTDALFPGATWAVNPRFSPSGEHLSYVASIDYGDPTRKGKVMVHRIGDAAPRAVTASGRYYGANTWSPDGRWVIARTQQGLEVVEVATGLALPLPWSYDFSDPDWKP